MVKTDKMYRRDEKELHTISLVNISGIKETNNVCPIINKINNSKSSIFLKTSIHNIFNNLSINNNGSSKDSLNFLNFYENSYF